MGKEKRKKLREIGQIRHFKILATRLVLVVAALFCAQETYAQQDPMYTQYMENLIMINPAYAGSKDLLNLMAVSRNQWVSLPNAPVSRTFSIQSPVRDSKMGLGFSVLSDHVGPVKQIGVYVDYSYKLYLSNQRTLALGLKGGVNFYEASLTDLTTVDPNDPVFASDINRNFLPNMGVGAFFYTNKYYIGLSVPKLIENTINQSGVSIQSVSKEQIHLFIMGGYVFDLNRIIKFKPSILTKYVKNAPISFDLDGTFLFYDRLWLGAIYRIGDSFGGMFQIQATNQLKIGYSYDLSINQLGAFNSGTHEIMVSYDFNLTPGKVRSPRYF